MTAENNPSGHYSAGYDGSNRLIIYGEAECNGHEIQVRTTYIEEGKYKQEVIINRAPFNELALLDNESDLINRLITSSLDKMVLVKSKQDAVLKEVCDPPQGGGDK